MADVRGRTSLKIPPEIMERLREDAKMESRSLHNMIIRVLTEYYRHKDEQTEKH